MSPALVQEVGKRHDRSDWADDFYEVVGGIRVENEPMGAREGRIANRLKRFVDVFDPEERLGTSEIEMRYVLRDEPRLERQPDFSFVTFDRCPLDRPMPAGSWNVVPDWVVEVISPGNNPPDIVDRVHEFFAAGVRLVWVVFPSVCEVYVYTSITTIRVATLADTLEAAPVLPDFRLPLRSLFVFRALAPDANGHD